MAKEISLIRVTWPFEADPLKGHVVQLNPDLKEAERFLICISNYCGLQYTVLEELPKPVDMYGESWKNNQVMITTTAQGFHPTPLSQFASGYTAALQNVKEYGLERVRQNAQSGIPK